MFDATLLPPKEEPSGLLTTTEISTYVIEGVSTVFLGSFEAAVDNKLQPLEEGAEEREELCKDERERRDEIETNIEGSCCSWKKIGKLFGSTRQF